MNIIVGKVFKKRYQISEKIAIGGTSDIYLGLDLKLDQKVVLKIFSFNVFEKPENKQIFFNEIETTSKLKHKNIVKIHDFFLFESYLCIVLEYVQGTNLRDFFSSKKIVTEKETINVFMKILEPLESMEQNLIVHGDLKPENIIVNSRKNIKILDFGISIDRNLREEKYRFNLIGSVKYLAPEVLASYEISIQNDIYSFGIMIFEALTDYPPFSSSDVVSLMKKHLFEDVVRIRSLNPEISQELENIIIKATAKNLNERYKSFKEIREDFSDLLEGKKKKPLFLKKKIYAGEIKNLILLNSKKPYWQKTSFLKKILFFFISITLLAFIIFISFLIKKHI